METCMLNYSRRRFMKSAAQCGIALGASCAGWNPYAVASPASAPLRWASLTPGFTVFLTDYMIATGIARKYGLDLAAPTAYTSVSTYYNDFVADNYDICIGSWDTFAARYQAGVPVKFVCGITTAAMIALVAPAGGVTTVKALKGKLIAVPQSTGTYRIARAVIKDIEGFDIEHAANVQNVDNPAASVSMVMASRADAALTWEPNISAGIMRRPDLKVLYNIGDAYRAALGADLPYFCVAIRQEALQRDPDLARKVDQAFNATVAAILADSAQAVRVAGAQSGIPADVLTLSIDSKRLQFKHISAAEPEGRRVMQVAGDFLTRNGLLQKRLDSGFFAF
jgi:NitT/TauT family transport system substrate-binding protein